MDISKFWKVIDKSRRVVDGEMEDMPESLKNELIKLSNEDILAFNNLYYLLMDEAYSWELWGVAYIIGGGCSDDSFTDFRSWLISKGQKAYETGLANPDSLTKFIKEQDLDIECQLEGLSYAATQAWEEKTGQEMPTYTNTNFNAEPTGTNWGGKEDNLAKLLPKMWKKFWS
ncbi:MAG TPA: DUF4240 domain-containing protein [Agitococcus sp.]|nr:DUF4240 domain-containing protein [Agitococcus sp.]